MAAERNRNNISMEDMRDPLFLHPYETSNSLNIDEKLSGSLNYRSWIRAVEISLSTR